MYTHNKNDVGEQKLSLSDSVEVSVVHRVEATVDPYSPWSTI